MIYNYACISCPNVQEENHSVNGFKEFTPKCTECGKDCKYKFIPSIVHVAFLDGPSGSWPSKGTRVKKQRAVASEKAKIRGRDRYGHVKRDAVPNFQGKETGTWREAQEHARKELGTASANTYNAKVKKENQQK